jgi:hypothetical protein
MQLELALFQVQVRFETGFPNRNMKGIEMKKNILRIALALALCSLLNAVALADGISKRVTFRENVMIGDTLVKKGNYKVKFDEQTNELTVLSGNKVVAKTTARLEEQKSYTGRPVAFRTTKNAKSETILLGVNLGEKFAILNSDGVTATAPSANAQ